MKGIVQFAIAATLVASATAGPHQHQHRHRHVKKHEQGSPVEKRGTVTTCEPAIATAYVYSNGDTVDANEAEQCIEDGKCLILGSSTPTFSPPPVPTTTSSSSSAAQFFESKTSETPTPTPSPSPSAQPDSNQGGTGLDRDFPDGTVECARFPAEYGAIPLDWLNLGGWSTRQKTGGWTPGVLIASISQPISGGCETGEFCSYACPPGYYKSQWPVTSQGATGQSIGGLWCGSDGKLHKTNPEFGPLCIPGVGGIKVVNQLSSQSCVCQTDYPANESPTLPLITQPGGEYVLTNMDANKAYQWQGKPVSGQFYVNPPGVPVEEACKWDSPTGDTGNWAAVNIGAGQDVHGITYISIFANHPTSSAEPPFDIVIEGDVNAPCWVKNGQYYGGATGCTTALSRNGGEARIIFKPKGSG